METKNFINASAEITRIVTLKKGDAYKRLEDGSYGDSIMFGIVTDVLNNGTDSAIQSIELKSSYSGVECENMVFAGNKDIKVFPAQADEVGKFFLDNIRGMKQSIADDKEKLIEKEKQLAKIIELSNSDNITKITSPESSNQLEEN
jgi:hypothetical protein